MDLHDLNFKRKNIREQYFSTPGLIIISILGCVGILMVFLSGLFNVKNFEMLYECISKNGMMIIFGLFFFIVFVYCCVGFFRNIILKPKKELLYSCKDENHDEVYFINKKGKKFFYNEQYKKENCYYYVLKTHDYIYEILEESNETFDNGVPKEKKSYWLNFYTPIGNFENIFLLPIAYVILLPGLLSFIMSEGYDKIYGLIFSASPLFVIVYDLIYKIKLKKSDDNIVDNINLLEFYELFKGLFVVIIACVGLKLLLNIFFKLPDFQSRLIFSPFLGVGFCSVGIFLSNVLKNYKLMNIFSKISVIIFLVFWFGFITFWTIGIIRQEGSYIPGLFSIPFWIAGGYMVYKFFIKDNKK